MLRNAYSYGDYFHQGQRARIDFQVTGRSCQEWMEIAALHSATLTLMRSGKLLAEVSPKSGINVVVRVGRRGQAYLCKGLLQDVNDNGTWKILLTDHVVTDEQREYYRLDTRLPMNVSRETPQRFWEGRNNVPIAARATGFPKAESSFKAHYTYLVPEQAEEAGDGPQIVNISGGGIRAEMTEEVETGTLVYVTFHLPLPEPKMVPAIAEVVHCEELVAAASAEEKPCYSVGLRYVNIHERDRDSIVQYVCAEEIKKMRNRRKGYVDMMSLEATV
jgi:hypothetical protein